MTIEITLESDELVAVADTANGAEITSLIDRRTGIDVLFRSPWRDHATAVIAGRVRARASSPDDAWYETYRGGWQTMLPTAGPAVALHGAELGFHGELPHAGWDVVEQGSGFARMRVEVFALPLVVDREMRVSGSQITIRDEITNASDLPLTFDYLQHPAFGGELLDSDLRIEIDGAAFRDAQRGPATTWPHGLDVAGRPADLGSVAPTVRRAVYGTIGPLTSRRARIVSQTRDLAIDIDWSDSPLDQAWIWQELSWSEGFPWYRRARVIAIEPSSIRADELGSPGRLSLDAHGTLTCSMTIGLGPA